jgi:hypothetical protein
VAFSHIWNNKPKAIPKPIHNILPGSQGREVSKNAYLDTMTFLYAKYEKEGKKGRGGLAGHLLM